MSYFVVTPVEVRETHYKHSEQSKNTTATEKATKRHRKPKEYAARAKLYTAAQTQKTTKCTRHTGEPEKEAVVSGIVSQQQRQHRKQTGKLEKISSFAFLTM